jgi:adenine phosphoribosyltransferase
MSSDLTRRLTQKLRAIPDYPKPGIMFQDITPILQDAALFQEVIDAMAEPFRTDGVTHVVGIEARGFILGGAIAEKLGAGFIPVRKPGKLPWETVEQSYELEYGADSLEAHVDAFPEGARALIVDDVIATGGTALATKDLAAGLGASVAGWAFLLAIAGLDGTARLNGAPVHTLVSA